MKLRNCYFILRHGETIYQTKKKDLSYPSFPEKPPIKLTKNGENQIKAAVKKLKKENVDLIFSSDFFRTKQTAKIAAKELALKINFDKRLRDINLGIYHGRAKKEFYQNLPENPTEIFYKKIPGGESWLDCQKRMLSFLKEIDKKYKGKTILIVSHGDPLWLLWGAVRNYSQKKLLEIKLEKRNYPKVGELRKLN